MYKALNSLKPLNASVTDIKVCCMGVEGNDLATIDFEIDGSKDKSNFPVSNLPVLKKICRAK
jgi:hypothetical protein